MSGSVQFTILVSACNAGRYVAQALRSVREQTFRDFECIVFVERSSDDTEEICRRETEGDSRFRIVLAEKSGSASVSRNCGIENASGAFLLFLDADDCLEPDALQGFSDLLAEKGEADVVAGAARAVQEQPDDSLRPCGLVRQGTPGASFDSGAAFLRSIDFIGYWIPATWMNLYRTDLLRSNRLYQAPGRLHQDDDWTYRVFLKAGRVLVAPFPHYMNRRNPNSVTHSLDLKTLHDRAENAKDACAFFRRGDFPQDFRKTLARYFCWNFFWPYFLARKYAGRGVGARLPRKECREALLASIGSREGFPAYCEVVRAAGGFYLAGIPLVALARVRMLFPVAEYAYRIWLNRILPAWRILFRRKGAAS